MATEATRGTRPSLSALLLAVLLAVTAGLSAPSPTGERAGLSALVAYGPAAAWAQGGEAGNAGVALKSACRTDYRAHCVGSDPAAPIAAACLAQFYLNLSKTCQAALDAYNAPPGDSGQE